MLHARHRMRILKLASIVNGIVITIQRVKTQENVTNEIELFNILENSALRLQTNLRTTYYDRVLEQAAEIHINGVIDRLEDWVKFVFLETRQFRFVKDGELIIVDVKDDLLVQDPYFSQVGV